VEIEVRGLKCEKMWKRTFFFLKSQKKFAHRNLPSKREGLIWNRIFFCTMMSGGDASGGDDEWWW
jgi:hypothetical protein